MIINGWVIALWVVCLVTLFLLAVTAGPDDDGNGRPVGVTIGLVALVGLWAVMPWWAPVMFA